MSIARSVRGGDSGKVSRSIALLLVHFILFIQAHFLDDKLLLGILSLDWSSAEWSLIELVFRSSHWSSSVMDRLLSACFAALRALVQYSSLLGFILLLGTYQSSSTITQATQIGPYEQVTVRRPSRPLCYHCILLMN